MLTPKMLRGPRLRRQLHEAGIRVVMITGGSRAVAEAVGVELGVDEVFAANSASKPVIVGEYGITAGEGCDSSFESRAERFAQKAEAYTNTEDGYAGALAWAWQPGGGGFELGNLDSDPASQDVLRGFR